MIDIKEIPGNNVDITLILLKLVVSNNDQEIRLRKLEPAQQELGLDVADFAGEPMPLPPDTAHCQCKEPFSYLGGKNCITCYKLIGSK